MLPDTQDPGLKIGLDFYGQYKIQQENIDALNDLSTAMDNTSQMVVVIMPVHKNFFQFFENGENDYIHFVEEVEKGVTTPEVPVVKVNGLSMDNKDLWWDYSHMTSAGADLFSQWIGQYLGRAASEKIINLSPG
jgi:hypothetical protein